MPEANPFPTIAKLAAECGEGWPNYEIAVNETNRAEQKLREILLNTDGGDRILNADASLVLCGSFARYEMNAGSDYDWTLLVDGVVANEHMQLERNIRRAITKAGLKQPGASETFGNMVFSHDLVHRIGGGADSNANLTRRMLMLLESRPLTLSAADSSSPVWENVLGNILQRYFEEDVHFAPGKGRVPRFLLNDLTRYWRTICVDYAAKHREQSGQKWALRNSKLRFSRKLLYASGLAFCLSCQLDPPTSAQRDLFSESVTPSPEQFIRKARNFARTPALEYLAAFIDAFAIEPSKKVAVARLVFGAYDWWLGKLCQGQIRQALEKLDPHNASDDPMFQTVRNQSASFAEGFELLFFNRKHSDEPNEIAKLIFQYIGF